ncbi:rho GTPase-activating protein SYDE1-like [Aplochiton taeniatus]
MDPQTRAQRRAGVVGSPGCEGGGAAGLERHNTQCPLEGGSPGSRHRNHDNTAENLDLLQVEPASAGVGGASDTSPASQKKVGVAGSMIDRIKSPGTVRKLSMKMKKLPELRRKLSLRSSRSRHGNASGAGGAADGKDPSSSPSNQNVISRYHLDSSAPARPLRRSSRGRSSSASKGGYLSDGDSPELLPRQTPPPALATPCSTAPGLEGSCDLGAFRLYAGSDQPRCAQRVTGLLTVHLLGLEEMPRPARVDTTKEVFCAIQVDGVSRARTSLLTCRGPALQLNHAFHLELERARLLRLVVLTPHTPTSASGGGANQATRNRVCCLGGVSLTPLFKASRSQQLCVKLEPRGLLYVKLSLQEQWQSPSRPSDAAPPSVFGVELRHLVEKEGSAATPVPLLIQKSVAEIEKRGLKVVGLYRLCGSAAVKKELRDAFERDSSGVSLNEELYPDINVLTGILKDYLRELPSPLITTTLYQVVLDAMATRPPRPLPEGHAHFSQDPLLSQATVALLHCLPQPERATLSILLDHLSLVASFSHCNRMSHQNLAVCFGPVLLTPTQESWRPWAPGGGGAGQGGGKGGGGGGGGGQGGGKSFAHSEEIASAVDFKRHIEALHYLLQLWPVPTDRIPAEDLPLSPHPSILDSPSLHTHNPLPRRAPLRLALPGEQEVVVSRRGRGRLESPPINHHRYAGDWSVCGRDFLSGGEADYDEVAGSESEEEEEEKKEEGWSSVGGVYVDDFALDFDAPFSCRLSLKDFDTLIHDLEKELAKQINICM